MIILDRLNTIIAQNAGAIRIERRYALASPLFLILFLILSSFGPRYLPDPWNLWALLFIFVGMMLFAWYWFRIMRWRSALRCPHCQHDLSYLLDPDCVPTSQPIVLPTRITHCPYCKLDFLQEETEKPKNATRP